jgi:Peptidase inhibitor I78 family
MERHKRLLAIASSLLAALALGGCAAAPAAEQPSANAAPGSCDASKAQFAVGRDPGLAIQDQARERSGARTVRTLRPGQLVTMEYSGDRLNLELDASGKVVRVRCG